MIGSFIGFKENKGGDWGENLLNTVATNTIRHLFTSCEAIEVKVRCQPSSKILQGTIDSFKMSGRGLVIRRDFRTEEMSFETDAVAIDFSSVMQQKIALKQPTQAIARVKLSEVDLNRSFEAELVKKRLENLSLPQLEKISGGKPFSFTDIKIELLSQNQIKLFARGNAEDLSIPIHLQCTLAIARRRKVLFQDIQFIAAEVPEHLRDTSRQLTEILGDILNEMVDLDRFNLDGVTMRLNRLEIQGKDLLFSGYAQIEHFPKTG